MDFVNESVCAESPHVACGLSCYGLSVYVFVTSTTRLKP
ncbi:unnamed protein product [Brassica rapa subsp. trilocularis]